MLKEKGSIIVFDAIAVRSMRTPQHSRAAARQHFIGSQIWLWATSKWCACWAKKADERLPGMKIWELLSAWWPAKDSGVARAGRPPPSLERLARGPSTVARLGGWRQGGVRENEPEKGRGSGVPQPVHIVIAPTRTIYMYDESFWHLSFKPNTMHLGCHSKSFSSH